jgi:hypothetical protein
MEAFFERTELSGAAATINGRLEKEQHFVPETLAQVRRWCHPYLPPVLALPTSLEKGIHVSTGMELDCTKCWSRSENALLVGSPGVEKTHLAITLGIETVRAVREVRFMGCTRLVGDLRAAQSRGILKKALKYYAHSKLLIIDELEYLDMDDGGANLLF